MSGKKSDVFNPEYFFFLTGIFTLAESEFVGHFFE